MMKAKKILTTTRTISAACITGLFVLVFSSCLKDKAPGNQNYSHSPALVGFQYLGNSQSDVPMVAGILGTPTDTFGLEVTLSVASLTLKSPVTLTISIDQNALDSFNAVNAALPNPIPPFVMMNSSLYTIANGGNVTINPGQQIVSVKISFAGDKIDFTQQNALAFQITNLKGATLATNLSTAILEVVQKNPYDGIYDLHIKTVGWGAYGIADGVSNDWGTNPPVGFVTTSITTSVFDLGYQPAFTAGGAETGFGATDPQFTFDPATNLLTAVVNLAPDDGRGRKFAINPAVTDSRFDPATKNIYMAYLMTQNGRPTQYIYDTLFYLGPRP